MKIINLQLYSPHCQQDKLVEVSEEVFEVLCQSVREMRNYERRKRYHRAYYSLDAYDWRRTMPWNTARPRSSLSCWRRNGPSMTGWPPSCGRLWPTPPPRSGVSVRLLPGRADPAADCRP